MRLRKIMSRASCLVLNGYAAATRGRQPTNKYSRSQSPPPLPLTEPSIGNCCIVIGEPSSALSLVLSSFARQRNHIILPPMDSPVGLWRTPVSVDTDRPGPLLRPGPVAQLEARLNVTHPFETTTLTLSEGMNARGRHLLGSPIDRDPWRSATPGR